MATTTLSAGKTERAAAITELRGMIKGASALVFMDTKGLDSVETFELRKAMRPTDSRLKVVKNRLMKIACREEQVSGADGWLKDNTAVAFVADDAVSALKALTAYAAGHDKLKLKGGLVDGKALALDELKALATLPGKRELLTMMATTMKSPIARGARDFKSVFQKMALLLAEAAKKAPKS
jgi:large subunit ribosomal protein L10